MEQFATGKCPHLVELATEHRPDTDSVANEGGPFFVTREGSCPLPAARASIATTVAWRSAGHDREAES